MTRMVYEGTEKLAPPEGFFDDPCWLCGAAVAESKQRVRLDVTYKAGGEGSLTLHKDCAGALGRTLLEQVAAFKS